MTSNNSKQEEIKRRKREKKQRRKQRKKEKLREKKQSVEQDQEDDAHQQQQAKAKAEVDDSPPSRPEKQEVKREKETSPELKSKEKEVKGKGISVDQLNDDDAAQRPSYSFVVDDTDHCETPFAAYRDIVDVLDRVACRIHKKRASLSIYDPYYCNGGVKQKLKSLGFHNVTNSNRDFYDDIATGKLPSFDVLVTNPPYSGIHMEKLLTFCANNPSKPCFLLLPHFVYTKDYYLRSLQSHPQKTPLSLFFLVPSQRYSYEPPKWVDSGEGSKALSKGKETTAPFPSFWYGSFGSSNRQEEEDWLVQSYGESGKFTAKHPSGLRYANCAKDIPRDFKGEFDSTKKRPNARARKRAAKKRRNS